MKSFKLFGSSKSKEEEQSETKKCHECLADIPAEATKCSHCGSKQKIKITGKRWAVIGILTVFIIFIFSSLGGGDGGSTTQQSNIDDGRAHIIAQNYVESVLKSPSTADFPTFDYQASDLGNDKYKVVSYVDAQNSFGAEVRSNYSVTLSYNGSGEWADSNNWTLHELIFDGEVMYSEE